MHGIVFPPLIAYHSSRLARCSLTAEQLIELTSNVPVAWEGRQVANCPCPYLVPCYCLRLEKVSQCLWHAPSLEIHILVPTLESSTTFHEDKMFGVRRRRETSSRRCKQDDAWVKRLSSRGRQPLAL